MFINIYLFRYWDYGWGDFYFSLVEIGLYTSERALFSIYSEEGKWSIDLFFIHIK